MIPYRVRYVAMHNCGIAHKVPSLWRRLSSLSIASTIVRMEEKVDSRDFSEVNM